MAEAKKKTTKKEQPEVVEAAEAVVTEQATPKKTVAKAGKRSEKALKETEEKLAKEERKTQVSEAEEKPKQAQKPARTRLERKGKKYQEAAKKIDRTMSYPIEKALALAIETSTTTFDSTVEMHIRLNVDPRQADQNIRDTIVLPAGIGKAVRVAVLANDDNIAAAKKAGADIAGAEDFLQQLDKGEINFDVLIATPSMMAKLGKYARTLGPKGLMPNPKSGTVTTDVTKAVTEAKAGRVEYRVDSTGIIHVGIGKVSFGAEKLNQNAEAMLSSIRGNKPASVKGTFVTTIYLTTSMGPSIRVEA